MALPSSLLYPAKSLDKEVSWRLLIYNWQSIILNDVAIETTAVFDVALLRGVLGVYQTRNRGL